MNRNIERIRHSSVDEVVTYLLNNSSIFKESPCSLAADLPSKPRILAQALRRLAQLPIEVLITYDKNRKSLVFTTGTPKSAVHPMLGPVHDSNPATQSLLSRLRLSPAIHNHPQNSQYSADNPKTTPSFADWSLLLTMNSGQHRVGWIISSFGLTKYSLPAKVIDVREFNSFLTVYRKKIASLDTTNIHQRVSLEYQFATAIGGEIEIIQWTNQKAINNTLRDFIVCNR